MGFYLMLSLYNNFIYKINPNIEVNLPKSSWRRCICPQQNQPWYIWHLGRKLEPTPVSQVCYSLILHPFKGLKVQTTTSKGCHIYRDKANCGSCVLAGSALGSLSSRASILLSYSTICPQEQHSPCL